MAKKSNVTRDSEPKTAKTQQPTELSEQDTDKLQGGAPGPGGGPHVKVFDGIVGTAGR